VTRGPKGLQAAKRPQGLGPTPVASARARRRARVLFAAPPGRSRRRRPTRKATNTHDPLVQ
jgi:hypothetical protein